MGEGVFIFLGSGSAETGPDIYSFWMLIGACSFYLVCPRGSGIFVIISIFFSFISFATIGVICLVLLLGRRGQIRTLG